MPSPSKEHAFSFAPFFMLFLPCAAISYFCDGAAVWETGVLAVAGITALCLVLFVARNWADLVAGMLGSLLLIALLSACALIPVVGWIADVLIILYALGSIFAAIGALTPFALQAAALWAVFLVALLPAVFHPIASPVVILLVALGLGASLGKKERPFDAFILLVASIPLLALAIASLGRLLQSGVVIRNAQFRQHVSGYTTRAGVEVGDYTRTITKQIAVGTTSVNPGAAAIGASAGRGAQDDRDA